MSDHFLVPLDYIRVLASLSCQLPQLLDLCTIKEGWQTSRAYRCAIFAALRKCIDSVLGLILLFTYSLTAFTMAARSILFTYSLATFIMVAWLVMFAYSLATSTMATRLMSTLL